MTKPVSVYLLTTWYTKIKKEKVDLTLTLLKNLILKQIV